MGNTVLPAKDLYVGTYKVMESDDGSLYQQGVKITASAANINALSNTFSNPLIDDGDAGITLTSADQTHGTPVATIPDIGDAADTFVMADTAQTLTNKTLTSPTLTTPLIDDSDAGVTITSADQTNAAATVTIPNIGDAADEFVMKDTAQTLTNKTLTTAVLTTPQINDTSADHQYVFAVSELAADRTVTLPLLTGADEFVFKDHAVTMTNKTLTSPALTSPVMTTPQINDTTADHQYVFAVSELAADRTVTLPLLTGADEFVFKDHTQTLTNKTLTTPKIATTGAIVDAGGDEYLKFVEATTPVTYVQITSGDTTVAPKVQGAGETNTDLHLLGTGTGNVKISDGTDPTKILQFELAGATTGKYCQFTISQADDTVITFPTATATLATVGGTENLTAKTLTSPKIDDGDADVTITSADQTNASATVTIPNIGDAADTFVMNDTAATLTNKTLTAPVITQPAMSFTIGAHDYGAGHADWTLDATEALSMIHKPTNADAGANMIIPTATIRPYIVINGTGQIVTVKTAAGSGIAIANGKTHIVMSDGTNVIALAAVSA
jgi:copper(I)-binding protein